MSEMEKALNVSRETFEMLEAFERLMKKWNKKINLVSPSTLGEFWSRHIEDSLEVWRATRFDGGLWLDLGSGGGLPGVVVAICARDILDTSVVLVESDARKCAFLRTVFRELGLKATVITDRIESLEAQGATVISARALASLDALLGFVERHGDKNCCAIFPKGARYRSEISDAELNWRFECASLPSKTRDETTILKITNIERK